MDELEKQLAEALKEEQTTEVTDETEEIDDDVEEESSEENTEEENIEDSEEEQTEETSETNKTTKSTNSEELSLEEIKQMLEDQKAQNIELLKQTEEAKTIQENDLKRREIDFQINAIDQEAEQLLAIKNQYLKALDNQEITAEQFAKVNTEITMKALKLKQDRDNLSNQKNSTPSQNDYIRIQQVRERNKSYFEQYKTNKNELKDELLCKNIEKLKKEYYDEFGTPLEEAEDWQKNVDWIANIIQEAETRGMLKEREKYSENKAKGKLKPNTNAQGSTKQSRKILNLNNLSQFTNDEIYKML